jgi:GST-like protein
MMLTLYENPGWGSAIVEAQLAFYGLPHDLVAVGDTYDDPAARERLKSINPLAQGPTLVLDDGQVITESAAMTLLLADLAASTALVPGPGEAERAAFLRWLVYLVAAIYPCFAFGDVPTRFVSEAEADAYKARVNATMMDLWRVMEAEAARRGGPWFLGARMTAVDVYIMVMVHWRPGLRWFGAETPQLAAIAARAAALPAFAQVVQRNFG